MAKSSIRDNLGFDEVIKLNLSKIGVDGYCGYPHSSWRSHQNPRHHRLTRAHTLDVINIESADCVNGDLSTRKCNDKLPVRTLKNTDDSTISRYASKRSTLRRAQSENVMQPVVSARFMLREQDQKAFDDILQSQVKTINRQGRADIYKPSALAMASSDDVLTSRRESRVSRERPWVQGSQSAGQVKDHKQQKVETHYEACVPKGQWLSMRHTKYARNPRLGEAFQIRREAKKAPFKPATHDWLIENDFRVWLFEHAQSRNLQVTCGSDGPYVFRQKKANGRRFVDKIGGHKELYETYHSERLQREKEQCAATHIQRYMRGWLVRHKLSQLNTQSTIYHGKALQKLAADYKALIQRLQRRSGREKPSAELNLDQVKLFMDQKLEYERTFYDIADGTRLKREKIGSFWHQCGLEPTEQEVEQAFTSVFKGCGRSAEVVLMLDCSANMGVVQHKLQQQFIRQLLDKLQIGAENTRVALVPFNTDTQQTVSLETLKTRDQVLSALELMQMRPGRHGCSEGLRDMRDVMDAARPGVPRACLLFMHACSTVTPHMQHEAKLARAQHVRMLPLVLGSAEKTDGLLSLASSPDQVFSLNDHRALDRVRDELVNTICRADCSYCAHGCPAEDPFHLQRYDPHTRQILDMQIIPHSDGSTVTPFSRGARDRVSKKAGRGLLKHEVLEILWTMYPPEGSGLTTSLQASTWQRPSVHGKQYAAVDERCLENKFDECLGLVLKSKLERQGVIAMPVGEKDVAKVSDYETAYKHARAFIKNKGLPQEEFYRKEKLWREQDYVDAFKQQYNTRIDAQPASLVSLTCTHKP